jgi:hypothetical protein
LIIKSVLDRGVRYGWEEQEEEKKGRRKGREFVIPARKSKI